ncbi:cytochrome c oxidase assembly protein [Trinickia sp. EG282A]|uniref:cytochrome c oxidase assembly protein n=1 Tax=Trinickia sp. EG282A TaxID=3237013 RepID=UPI0034D1FF66
MPMRPCRRPRAWAAATAFAACVAAPSALAHPLPPAERSIPPTFGWEFTPWVTPLLAVSLAAYWIGYARLRSRGNAGRAKRDAHLIAFAAGWLVLAAALVSPLDSLSEALFSAHMVQHESMMIVAAPLLVAGRPLGLWVWALPRRARSGVGRVFQSRPWRAFWRWIVSPVPAWILHATALWVWHAPALFEAALANPLIHTLQHASFLITALLFWWSIVGDGATRRRSGHAMLSLFTTMAHTGALGALITLAPGLWYPSYIEPASALGFDPLHDQQLGGLIMWVPAALAYLLAALGVAGRWLTRGRALSATPRPIAVTESRSSGSGAPSVPDASP